MYKLEINMVKPFSDISNQTADANTETNTDRETAVNLYVSPLVEGDIMAIS